MEVIIMANGWIKERYFKSKRVLASMTASAEYQDAISVSVLSVTNDDLEEEAAVVYHFELFDVNMDTVASTAYRISVGTGTTAVSTDAKSALVGSVASGGGTISITDVVGGTSATLVVKATPLNGPGFPTYISVTFS
jgi:hypothetical protein